MKNTIFILSLLLFGSNALAAAELIYTSEDGIKVLGRGTVERTLRDGHCRQDENPYDPDYASDFCDEKHIETYRELIEAGEVNFADKYILALLYQDPKDNLSKDKKSGNSILKLAGNSQRDLVVIDPKTKSVYTLSLAVKGVIEFSKTTNSFELKGTMHGYRMDTGPGTFTYYFGINHFEDDDDTIGFYTHPCGSDF